MDLPFDNFMVYSRRSVYRARSRHALFAGWLLVCGWLCVGQASATQRLSFAGWDFNHQCLGPLQDLQQTVFSCDIAIRIAQRFHNADSSSQEQSLHLANLHLAKANAEYFIGEIKSSILAYRRVISLNDWRASAHAGLGRSLYVQRQDEHAKRALDQAIALFPDYALAHRYRGLIALRAGDTRAAITDLLVAVKLRPFVAENHVLLGIAQLMQGALRAARQSFDNAHDRRLAWDYLPIWQFLSSPRQGEDRQKLADQLEHTAKVWPGPLIEALLDPDVLSALQQKLIAPNSASSLNSEQRIAAIFYTHLYRKLVEPEGFAWPVVLTDPESDVDLTIEQQLLPPLLQGVLPIESG